MENPWYKLFKVQGYRPAEYMPMNESQVAAQVINRYGHTGRIVVHPKEIAERMGCQVEALPIGSQLSGEYVRDAFDRPVLRFNSTESAVRQRFTVAHELGHYVLGHSSGKRDPARNYSLNEYDPAEAAANRFASELLMPSETVRRLVRVNGITSVSSLAETLQVSELAMKYRLQKLGIIR